MKLHIVSDFCSVFLSCSKYSQMSSFNKLCNNYHFWQWLRQQLYSHHERCWAPAWGRAASAAAAAEPGDASVWLTAGTWWSSLYKPASLNASRHSLSGQNSRNCESLRKLEGSGGDAAGGEAEQVREMWSEGGQREAGGDRRMLSWTSSPSCWSCSDWLWLTRINNYLS